MDAVALLKGALAIPSPSGQEREVAAYLVGQMSKFADEAFVDEVGNAVARVGYGPRRVTFLGHIDTAPGEIPIRIEAGELWGRGAVDAKGPLCAAIAAAAGLPAAVKDKLTLTLMGAVEEEAPSSKGARYAIAAYPKPEMVIIGEPSGWDAITLGYKGRLVVKLSLRKWNFHSAAEDATAAAVVADAWQRVRAWASALSRAREGIFEQVQASLQSIQSRNDGLEQHAEAAIGLRLPPWLSPGDAEAALRETLATFAVQEDLQVTFSGHERPYRGLKDTPLSRAFRLAIREVGGRPRFKVKSGTSDMNVVAPHWPVPMLAYGPGDSALDHRPDERLSLAEYERAIRVLQTALTLLAEG
jgi:LysW-gamma-L-lysine carboxypeptidase